MLRLGLSTPDVRSKNSDRLIDRVVRIEHGDTSSERPYYEILSNREPETSDIAQLLNDVFDAIPQLAQSETDVQYCDGRFYCRMVFAPLPQQELEARRNHRASPVLSAAHDVRAIMCWGMQYAYPVIFGGKPDNAILEYLMLAVDKRALLYDRWRPMDAQTLRHLMPIFGDCNLLSALEKTSVSGRIKEITGNKSGKRVTVSLDFVINADAARPKGATIRDVMPLALTIDFAAHSALLNGIVTAAAYLKTSFALENVPVYMRPALMALKTASPQSDL